jgi:hypothetical protein
MPYTLYAICNMINYPIFYTCFNPFVYIHHTHIHYTITHTSYTQPLYIQPLYIQPLYTQPLYTQYTYMVLIICFLSKREMSDISGNE